MYSSALFPGNSIDQTMKTSLKKEESKRSSLTTMRLRSFYRQLPVGYMRRCPVHVVDLPLCYELLWNLHF